MAIKQVFSVTAWGHPWTPVVFGCIRVSQAEGESGLATQRRTLNEHGLRDDRIYTDVTSGKSMRRPAWQQLRGILRPGDVVVVPRIDRLARNLSEGLRAVQELHEQGIHIRALAEWERDSIEMRDQRKIRDAATPRQGVDRTIAKSFHTVEYARDPSFPRKRESAVPTWESRRFQAGRRQSNNFAILLRGLMLYNDSVNM